MLGRLAKWLRILGYDTAYDASADDHALVRQARAEGRIQLTRDTALARRRGVQALLIHSQDVEDQVRQVLEELNLTPVNAFSRCPVCNIPLEHLEPSDAKDRVPPYVYATQDQFRSCSECGRVYWRGTHWAQMQAQLNNLSNDSV
jgi:hypothetical protein